MALPHESSEPATIAELDLFNLPLTQTASESEYCLHIRPISTITANSVVEFVFGGEGRDYLDLARSRLYMKIKLLHQDGTSLVTQRLKTDGTPDPAGPKDEKATLSNMAMHSLWNQIDVYINGTRMSQASGMYPYKALIQTHLGYGVDAKETQLTAVGYKLETGKDLDAYSLTNPSLYWRHNMFSGSKTVEFEGPLLEDVMQLKRYLLNNMKVQLKLYPSQKQFVISATDATKDYKVELVDIVFKACMVKVNPGVILGHAKAMETRNAIYGYTKCETKSYSLTTGQRTVYLDNLFQGNRPSKLVVGLVSAEGFNGSFTKNPFKFHHYDLSEITLVVDGESLGRPFRTDFSAAGGRNYIEPYVNMFEALGQSRTDFGSGITPDVFASGHTLFVYSLDPVIRSGKYMNLTKHSNVRLELNFSKPLPETVTAVIYTEIPDFFDVDATRNVIQRNN
jgi:hypothetical protein